MHRAIPYSKGQCETSQSQRYCKALDGKPEISIKIAKVVAALPIARFARPDTDRFLLDKEDRVVMIASAVRRTHTYCHN